MRKSFYWRASVDDIQSRGSGATGLQLMSRMAGRIPHTWVVPLYLGAYAYVALVAIKQATSCEPLLVLVVAGAQSESPARPLQLLERVGPGIEMVVLGCVGSELWPVLIHTSCVVIWKWESRKHLFWLTWRITSEMLSDTYYTLIDAVIYV